jgi:hypothetical protein
MANQEAAMTHGTTITNGSTLFQRYAQDYTVGSMSADAPCAGESGLTTLPHALASLSFPASLSEYLAHIQLSVATAGC